MKQLIVNADDFGLSTGVNRAIVECHVNGVVTSASLMVTGDAVDDAVELAAAHPGLSVGLHWDVLGEEEVEREFDTRDGGAVRAELARQLDEFRRLLGREPTHVDSHRHVHREPHVFPIVRALVESLGVPLRGDGRVVFVGGFYAQWEWGVTQLEYVGVPFLQRLLRDEVGEGWTELSCHPGYVPDDCTWVYGSERTAEVATLTDPRIRATLDALGITLAGFSDVAATALS